MDLGSLVASFGANLNPLERSVARAKTLYNEYSRSAERKLGRVSYAWMRHGKKIMAAMKVLKNSIFSLKTALVAMAGGFVVRNFLGVASSFEQMRIKLDALTKGRGMETLEKLNAWALKMPVNTQKAVSTFAMMKAMGLDPTIKSMNTLVDVSTLFGEEAMQGVARALGQIHLLGRLSAQDLNQLANAGIAARKYLKEAFGTSSTEEINKMGYTVDQAITAIMKGMQREFGGAAKLAMSTWRGVTDYFKSVIVEFERYLAKMGFFTELEKNIRSLADQMFDYITTQKKLKEQNLPNIFDRANVAVKNLIETLESLGIVLLDIAKLANTIRLDKWLKSLGHVIQLPGVWAKVVPEIFKGNVSFFKFATSNFEQLTKLLEEHDKEKGKLLNEARKYAKMGLVSEKRVENANIGQLRGIVSHTKRTLVELKQLENTFPKSNLNISTIPTTLGRIPSPKPMTIPTKLGRIQPVTVPVKLGRVPTENLPTTPTDLGYHPKPVINLKPYKDLVEQLKYQIQLVKENDIQQEVDNQVRQLGINLTKKQVLTIHTLVKTLYDEKSALNTKSEYNSLVKSLTQEYNVIGKSNVEKRETILLSKLSKNLTVEQVDTIKKLVVQIDKKSKQVEESRKQDELAKQIISDTESMQERYNKVLLTYNVLLKQGKINVTQYDSAVDNLKKSFGLDEVKQFLMTEKESIQARYDNYRKIVNTLVADQKIKKELLDKLANKMNEDLKAIGNNGESLSNTLKSAFEGWANDFSSTLNDILWGSKVTFAEIAKSFAKMITQMIIEKQIVEPLFGSLFPGGTASKKHSGGIIGSGGVLTPVPKLHSGSGSSVMTSISGLSLPKFHSGLMPNEYVAVLKKGEGVFTPEQMRALGENKINVIVNNNSKAETNVEQRANATGGKDIILTIDEALGNMINNDMGQVAKSLRLRGLKPNLIGR